MSDQKKRKISFDFLRPKAKDEIELPGYLRELQRAPSADSRNDLSAFIGRRRSSMDSDRSTPRNSANDHASSNEDEK